MTNHPYEYKSVDIAIVASDIDEYIIPENQEACKLLWSKNIFTIMCNNYDNDDSWITLSELDKHNQKVFNDMVKKDKSFGETWGGIGITISVKPGSGDLAFQKFKPLIELFAMQDVQKEGYMEKCEFLTYGCDCYKMVPDPDFLNSNKEKIPMIREFDESKMTKSFEEYLEESQYANYYDSDNERIYYNEFYYEAHLRYKNK